MPIIIHFIKRSHSFSFVFDEILKFLFSGSLPIAHLLLLVFVHEVFLIFDYFRDIPLNYFSILICFLYITQISFIHFSLV